MCRTPKHWACPEYGLTTFGFATPHTRLLRFGRLFAHFAVFSLALYCTQAGPHETLVHV